MDNFKSPAALSRFFLTTILGLAADLATKAWAFSALANHVYTFEDGTVHVDSRTYHFIPKILDFTCVANQGAVFGIGQGQRALFVSVSMVAIIFLTYLFARSGKQRFYQFLLGLLLAGVLGNMYDRIVYHFVRDMIHALPGVPNPLQFLYHAPEIFPWVFNVADSLLCVGVALMLLYSFLHRPPADALGTPQNEHVQRSI